MGVWGGRSNPVEQSLPRNSPNFVIENKKPYSAFIKFMHLGGGKLLDKNIGLTENSILPWGKAGGAPTDTSKFSHFPLIFILLL